MKLERWQLAVICSALFLLVISISLDNPFLVVDGKPQHESYFFSRHALVLFSGELAFALIIAFVISVSIERWSTDHERKTHEEMRKAIAEDVFRGVFSHSLPRNYIDAVVDRDLRVRIVRDWVKTENRLRPLRNNEAAVGSKEHVVAIERTIRYSIRNITSRDLTENLKVFLPVGQSSLANETTVSDIRVDDIPLDGPVLARARSIQREGTTIAYEWSVELPAGTSKLVEIKSLFFKERSDNDIFSFHGPVFRYEVLFASEEPFAAIGMFERTAGTVANQLRSPDKGLANWTIDGPILPNDTITIWWTLAQRRHTSETALPPSPTDPTDTQLGRPDRSA